MKTISAELYQEEFDQKYAHCYVKDGNGYTLKGDIKIFQNYQEKTNRFGDAVVTIEQSPIMHGTDTDGELSDLDKQALKYQAIFAGEKYAEGNALHDGDYERLAELVSNSIKMAPHLKAVVFTDSEGKRSLSVVKK
jgi:hypothetical protein